MITPLKSVSKESCTNKNEGDGRVSTVLLEGPMLKLAGYLDPEGGTGAPIRDEEVAEVGVFCC